MALARIDVVGRRDPEQRRSLLRAVLDGLVESLQVPDDDPTVRLVEHASDSVIVPPRHSALYTTVEITMFAGRTETTKRRLHKTISANIASLGVPPNDILVVM